MAKNVTDFWQKKHIINKSCLQKTWTNSRTSAQPVLCVRSFCLVMEVWSHHMIGLSPSPFWIRRASQSQYTTIPLSCVLSRSFALALSLPQNIPPVALAPFSLSFSWWIQFDPLHSHRTCSFYNFKNKNKTFPFFSQVRGQESANQRPGGGHGVRQYE